MPLCSAKIYDLRPCGVHPAVPDMDGGCIELVWFKHTNLVRLNVLLSLLQLYALVAKYLRYLKPEIFFEN